MEKRILVTGGAGNLGSRICKSLQEAGFTPVILDHLQGHTDSLPISISLIKRDILETGPLSQALSKEKIQAVIHCASVHSVEESKAQPELYYKNNVDGLLSLLKALQAAKVKTLIAAKDSDGPASPFARTQAMMAQILEDCRPAMGLNISVLSSDNAEDYVKELKKFIN